MKKVHKILERAVTPDGINIQIEDWTEIYPDTYKAYNIGCYPVAKQTGRYGLIKKGISLGVILRILRITQK